MLPILVQFSFIKIYTFGVFLVLALFWGSFFLWKNIRLTAYKEDEIFDGLFYAIAGGALVGRAVHVALHFNDFGLNFMKFILFNGFPGFSFWGFLLGFFLSLYLFAQSQKIRFVELVDYVIPPLFLTVAIGKVGSFFSGVEVGAITKFPLAIKYANFDGMRHVPALYQGIVLFIGVYFAYRMLFAIRREHLSKGFLFLFFLWMFSAVAFATDTLFADRTMLYGYSFFGVVSLVILLTLSVYFLYYFRTAIVQSTIGNLTRKNYGQSSHSGIHQKAKNATPRGKS